ncbi:ATP-dependent endonuclease [Cryobacterium sp. PAMC25264]|uniref:ATP-dependent nuclease n=1 Tax=Cryobacterium sp. PAMC25264 TaxID=2861288 RepID=UPI001C62D0D9|nr:ATP-dependent endonuclease [Cryobacterium sp. PAMC25264]QYF74879.1 ATP-dependent endonuclease [Cryobacterium sp. PAMC25264]
MRISTVTIKNFRSLRDVSINFDNVTTFIGPNGTGKSTVLLALDWFFNGGKSGALTENDHSHGAMQEAIEVRVTFDVLTIADRSELGKYSPAGANTFTAWKRRAADGEETLSANARGLGLFVPIKEAVGAAAKKDLYNAIRQNRPDLHLPVAGTVQVITDAMTAWESANSDELDEMPEHLQTDFFGFNSNSKMSGLFDFVLVTADLRASEESQDAKNSIIARILERSVNRSAADAEVLQIVENSRVAQQAVYDEKFKDQLDAITDKLGKVISSYSPGRSISVRPAEIELKAPRTTFRVAIIDGEAETSVDRQGHGFQRTLLVSALQLLAQSGTAGTNGVICLAIEEPELFQHPIQAQAFAKVLRSLAEAASQNVQVTYATHSPYFVEARHFAQVRRLSRKMPGSTDVTVDFSNMEKVMKLTGEAVRDSTVASQMDGTIASRLPVALFANRVLLVEGTTEVAVLHGIADRTEIGSLESLGVSVVDVGGKENIALAHAILTSLGIPTYCMFDGDSGFAARARKQGKNAAKVEEERKGHIASNMKLTKYFKLPESGSPAQTESSVVTILSDHLEELMQREWSEWRIACEEYESHNGINLAKNQDAYRAATLASAGSPSALLLRVIARASGDERDAMDECALLAS